MEKGQQQCVWAFNSSPNPWDGSPMLWKNYSDETSTIIEKAFNDKCTEADIGDYKVDFAKMVQVHKKDEFRKRQVQRIDKNLQIIDNKQAALPPKNVQEINPGPQNYQHLQDNQEEIKLAYIINALKSIDISKVPQKNVKVFNQYEPDNKLCPVINKWKSVFTANGTFSEDEFANFESLKCNEDGDLLAFDMKFLEKLINATAKLKILNDNLFQIFSNLVKVLQSHPEKVLLTAAEQYSTFPQLAYSINQVLRSDTDDEQALFSGAFCYILFSFIDKMTSKGLKEGKNIKSNLIVWRSLDLDHDLRENLIEKCKAPQSHGGPDDNCIFQWNAFTTANERQEVAVDFSTGNTVFDIEIPHQVLSVEGITSNPEQKGEVLLNSGSVFLLMNYQVENERHFFSLKQVLKEV